MPRKESKTQSRKLGQPLEIAIAKANRYCREAFIESPSKKKECLKAVRVVQKQIKREQDHYWRKSGFPFPSEPDQLYVPPAPRVITEAEHQENMKLYRKWDRKMAPKKKRFRVKKLFGGRKQMGEVDWEGEVKEFKKAVRRRKRGEIDESLTNKAEEALRKKILEEEIAYAKKRG